MRHMMSLCIMLLALASIVTAQDEPYAVITPENANRLEHVGSLGHGLAFRIGYIDNNSLIMYGEGGIWEYNLNAHTISSRWSPMPFSTYSGVDTFPIRRQLPLSPALAERGISELGTDQTATLQFSPSGQWLTFMEPVPDGSCRGYGCPQYLVVWDVDADKVRSEIAVGNPRGSYFAMADTRLVVIYDDHTDFYDVFSGRLDFVIPTSLGRLSSDGYTATHVEQLADGRFNLTVWDLDLRQEIMRLTFLPDEWIICTGLNMDGSRLAVVSSMEYSEPFTISVWNVRTGERIAVFDHGGPVRAMLFSPDNRYLLAYDSFGMGSLEYIKLYDLTAKRTLLFMQNERWRDVTDAAFSPNSQELALVYADGYLQRFDTSTGSLIEDVQGYPGYVVDAVFTEESILTTNEEDETFVWDSQTFARTAVYSSCTLLAYHEASDTALCRDEPPGTQGDTVLRHLTTGEDIAIVSNLGTYFAVLGAAFRPDGQQVAVTDFQDVIRLVNTATGEVEKTMLKNLDYSFGVQYSQDGRYLAAGGTGTVWDISSGKVVVQPQIEPAWQSNLAISEAGDWYALPSLDGHVYVWRWSDLLNGAPATPQTAAALVITVPDRDGGGRGQFIFSAASPDGRLLAIQLAEEVRLFDTQTFEQVAQIPDSGNLLRFSPNGRLLLVGNGYCYSCGADESYHMGYARLWGVPSTQ